VLPTIVVRCRSSSVLDPVKSEGVGMGGFQVVIVSAANVELPLGLAFVSKPFDASELLEAIRDRA